MTRKPAQQAMLTVAEVAQRLGMDSPSQVYKLIRARHLAHVRLPSTGNGRGAIRVDASELDRFIRAHTVPAST